MTSPLAPDDPFFPSVDALLPDAELDLVSKAWLVELSKIQRLEMRALVSDHIGTMRWCRPRSTASDRIVSRIFRQKRELHNKIARVAANLAELLEDDRRGFIGSLDGKVAHVGALDLLVFYPKALAALAELARYEPEASDRPRPGKGRPSYRQWRELITGLASVSRWAGCRPSTSWNNYRGRCGSRIGPFWDGIAIINRNLPLDVRAQSVVGLAEHAHRHKWLAQAAGRK